MNVYIETDNKNPYHNLAIEEVLLNDQSLPPTLYLWQNAHTVVIGRHQNAWKECRAELLEREGGLLARRSTGGGAVFHDLGNLNFTFAMPISVYDVTRQCSVILNALKALGINAGFTGRNDLEIAGAKFSGNAFVKTHDRAVHHGTLLFDVDMGLLSRYLAPSKLKLEAKGVESVRQRVTNLCEHRSDLSLDMLKEALQTAFKAEYGDFKRVEESELDGNKILAAMQKYSSWEFRYGQTPPFDVSFENRFEGFGSIELNMTLKDGYIHAVTVYSDANDGELIEKIAPALNGCEYTADAIYNRVCAIGGSNMESLAAALRERLE